MTGWVTQTIGELCDYGEGEVKTGPFGSQLHQSDYQETGTPVIMPKDIIDGKVDESSIARVSENHVERLSVHKLALGNIVFGRRGDIGRQALIRKENVGWLCGTGSIRITLGNSLVSPEFLHLYLQLPGVVSWITNQAIGATMPNLNTKILRSVPVYYPSDVATQQNIVAILTAYDDLIENNNKRITLLEKASEEIYREWFVRMRFPGWEQVNFVKGFPDDWEIVNLGQIVELAYGKSLKDSAREPGPFPVFGSGGIVGTHTKALVKAPGIIVGRKGSVGSIHWSDDDFYPIDTVYYVKSKFSFRYLFYLLHQMNFINNDSAVPGLNRNQACSNKFYLPKAGLINEFDRVIKSFLEQRSNLSRQNKKLKKTRDLLLSRLISGKLPVDGLDIHFPPSMVID